LLLIVPPPIFVPSPLHFIVSVPFLLSRMIERQGEQTQSR
jgi:hypothetical protein